MGFYLDVTGRVAPRQEGHRRTTHSDWEGTYMGICMGAHADLGAGDLL